MFGHYTKDYPKILCHYARRFYSRGT
jgi:hypothetical protein